MGSEKYIRDEFKFDPDIQKMRKEKAAFLMMIRDSLAVVNDAFNAKVSSKKNLSNYLLHQSLPTPFVEDAFTGSWKGQRIYITTIMYYSSVAYGRIRSAGYDNYLMGIITLKNRYPHTIIQPEILKLKLENLLTRQDVDFKHARLFSFLFYVITKDKILLKQQLKDKDLDKINKFLDAEIEIIGTQCYFRVSRKPISIAEAKKFVRLGQLLTEIL